MASAVWHDIFIMVCGITDSSSDADPFVPARSSEDKAVLVLKPLLQLPVATSMYLKREERHCVLPAGRLEDKAALVRKAALQLLVAMLMYNPFGGELPLELFANSLQEYSDKLKVTIFCLLVPCCCEFPAA